jgi:diguanylate cyclase (GGDEF)-like protein
VALGRVGGEEFAAAFPEDEPLAAARCREALRTIAETRVTVENESMAITLSAGVAGWATSGDKDSSLQATYELADRTLYEAKHAGRNRAATPRLVA